MRKVFIIVLATLAVLSCKKESRGEYFPEVYSITGDYSNLTPYSVTLSGTAYTTSIMRDVDMGIILSENPEPKWEYGNHLGAHDNNTTYSVTIDYLRPETTYYYRSYLYSDIGVNLRRRDYGEIKSFTTPANNVSATFDHVVAGSSSIYLTGSVSVDYERSGEISVRLDYGQDVSTVESGFLFESAILGADRTFKFTINKMWEDGFYYRIVVHFDNDHYPGEILHVPSRTYAPTSGDIIDMGLSVKWRSCNVGADSPEKCGDYYSWGETSTKAEYTEYYYSFPTDVSGELPLSKDAAYANLGERWRMPTSVEFEELLNNSLRESGEYKSVPGNLLISKKNGNALFFPAAGYNSYITPDRVGIEGDYWTSSIDSSSENAAYEYCFYYPEDIWTNSYLSYTTGTYFGCSIRPVYREL